MLFARFLRAAFWVPAGLSLGLLLAGCKHDSDSIDPTPAAPTAYKLEVPAYFPAPNLPTDNPLTNEGVALGRMLFYEKKLSGTNTMSCGSCHQQSKAFTDGRALAVGVDGVQHRRGSMSLANVLWNTSLNWDGAFTKLEDQARFPIENPVELHQPLAQGVAKLQATDLYPPLFLKAFGTKTITEDLVLKALAQFERTLISANSRYDQVLRTGSTAGLTSDEQAGLDLYTTHITLGPQGVVKRGAECLHCHNQPLMTARDFFNNGLDLTFADPGRGRVTNVARDNGKFIAPSLRNIALTAPYMHDGRFQTLEQVLDHYSDHVQKASPGLDVNLANAVNNPPFGLQMDLTPTEKRQIIAFLKTLTDSTFIKDKRFSDPF